MPIYEVDAPNGKTYRVEGPADASPESIGASFMANLYPGILQSEKPKPERGIGQLFTQGFGRGVAQTGVLLGDYLPALAGRGVQRAAESAGADTIANAAGSFADRQLREAAQSELEIAKKYPREFNSYEDITGPMSALRYGAEALGEGLPSLAPGLVTGGAGALAARGLSMGARAAASVAATGIGSASQTVPEAYASILRETGKEEVGASLIAGGINAALESVLPATVLAKMSGPAKEALIGSIKKRLGLGLAEGAITEGLTEGAQEAVNQAAISFVDSNKEFFTSENWREILDNAIRGAIVGAPVSGVSNVAFGKSAAEQPAPEKLPEAPPVFADTDTPEQKKFRQDNLATLANLGYQQQEIGSIPFADIQKIIDDKILADDYFGKKQAPVTQTEQPQAEAPVAETPAPETPVVQPEAPVAPVTPTAAETPAPETPVAAAPAAPAPVTPTITPTPVETPAPAPAAAPVSTELPAIPLPKNLAGASPNYAFGTALFNPEFANDIDKALYVTAQATKSKSDEAYRQFLRDNGFTDAQINEYGKKLRDHLKMMAKDAIDNGKNGGSLFVDFMRTQHAAFYQQLVAPQGPSTVAPAPTVTATETPQGPAVVAKTPVPPKSTPAVPIPYSLKGPSPFTEFVVSNADYDRFEKLIPGIMDVIRAIHANLYPGTKLNLDINNAIGNNTFGQFSPNLGWQTEKPFINLSMNMKAIENQFKKTADQKRFLLKTLFHELSHPLQYTWLNTVDDKTFSAIVKQYVKERNPNAMHRAVLMEMLTAGRKDIDSNFYKTLLTNFQIYSEENLKKFLASTTKTVSSTEYGPVVAQKYIRSFNEWVAEKGAEWMTKELKGIVPKTTFEKFQKSVLDSLRRMYRVVAQALGIKPKKGAFEKMLYEIYGQKTSTPTIASYEDAGRSSKQYPALITRNLSGFGTTFNSELQRNGLEPTGVEVSTQEQPAPTNPVAKTWRDYQDVISKEDNTLPGMFGRFMRKLVGAEPGEGLGRAFVRNTINSSIPFLERADLRNLGKLIEGAQNATGRVMGTVTIGPLGYSRANKTFFYHNGYGGLMDIFKDIGTANMDQAQIVFLAMRELALRKERYVNKDGKSVLPEGTNDLSNKDLEDIVKSADPKVLQAAEKFQRFNDRMVDMAVQSGLIPRELGDRFKTLMYTPMYRVQDEELAKTPNITLAGGIYDVLKDPQSIATFNKKVGTLGVGGAVNGNLYENILRNYNAIISAAVRNNAYQETANTLTQLSKNGGDTTIGEVFDKPVEEGGIKTIQFRVNGQDRHLLIRDPAMFQAVAALSPQQKNEWVRAASKYTSILRVGVTSTPPFQLRNLIRGLVELKVKTGMPTYDLLKGTLDGVIDTMNKGAAYQSILGHTGFGGFGFGSGSKDQANYMARVFKSRELSWNEWQKYPNAFMRFFDKMEGVGELTEMGPRIAYYNYLRRKGLSEADATWEAVNLVNYHRHGAGNGVLGSAVSNLIPLTPFLTARIQGLYRLVETGTDGSPKAIAGLPAALVSRGLMVMAINAAVNMMYGDDDWYKKLSVKDRLNNMYVKVGDVVIALPRAYEIGELFGALPTLMLDSIRKQNGNDIAMGTAEWMKKTFLFEVTPQVFKPIAEIIANKNFYTGQPIESLSDKRSPSEERFDEYTSSIAKMAGQISKTMENTMGVPALSPKQIDTLIRGYLGTAATLFLGTVDSLVSTAGTRPQGVFGDPTSIAGVAGNLSGLSSILKTESQLNNKYIGDFYEIKQKVTEIVQSMNDAALRGDTEKIKERLAEMPQAKGLYTSFNSAAAKLSEINRQMDAIRTNPKFDVERKTEMLEKLRAIKGQLATQMVTAAEKVGVSR